MKALRRTQELSRQVRLTPSVYLVSTTRLPFKVSIQNILKSVNSPSNLRYETAIPFLLLQLFSTFITSAGVSSSNTIILPQSLF